MEQVSEVTEFQSSSPVVQSTDSRHPFVHLREQSGTCSSSRCRSQRSLPFLFNSTTRRTTVLLVMPLWFHLLHHVCVSLVQPPTLTHQQPCALVSLASTSLALSDQYRSVPPSASPLIKFLGYLWHLSYEPSTRFIDLLICCWCLNQVSPLHFLHIQSTFSK